ncbi:hypothetical protein D3C76_1267120 [compost metagenome]
METTTSWMPLRFSKAASCWVSWWACLRDIRAASSTTRPLSGGKAGAACSAAVQSSSKGSSARNIIVIGS